MKNIVYALGVLVVCANVGAMNLDGNFRECRKGQGARFNEKLFETEEQDKRAPIAVPDIVSAARQQEMISNIIERLSQCGPAANLEALLLSHDELFHRFGIVSSPADMLRQEAFPAEPQCRVEVLEGATSAVVARPVQAVVPGPVQAGVAGPVQAVVPGPVQAGVARPVQAVVPGPVPAGVARPVQAVVARPVQAVVARPVQAGVARPVQAGVAGPVQAGVARPVQAVVPGPVQAATADVRSSREVQVSEDRVMLVKRMPAGRISLLPRSRTITMHIETQGNISGLLANSDLSMCSNQFRDRLPNTRGIIYENVPPDTSVRITDSIRKIDKKRYRGWANLTEVVFSERSRVEIIKELEFCDCVSLQSITISASVLTLCEACFKGCCRLSTVQFAEKSALGLISEHAFFGCKSLRSIKIPAGVKRIGIRAFKWCASLSDVKFEDNSMLQLIDEEAFWGCAITVITIPASVLGIGQMCFAMCPNLKEIIFAPGSQLRALGKIAFGVLPLKITLYDSWLSSPLDEYTRSTSGINQHSFAQIVSEEKDSSETE